MSLLRCFPCPAIKAPHSCLAQIRRFTAYWVLSSAAGCVLGQFLPEVVSKSFGVAFYAAFLAMLLPNVQKSRKVALLVLLAAGMNTAMQLFLPVSWAVILSMVISTAIGTFFVEAVNDEQA